MTSEHLIGHRIKECLISEMLLLNEETVGLGFGAGSGSQIDHLAFD